MNRGPLGGLTHRSLARRAALFGLGNVLARMPDLLLLPVYVALLPAEEYGLVGVAASVTLVLRPTLNAGIHAAGIHFFFKSEDEDGWRTLYGNLWIFSVVVSGLVYFLIDQQGVALFGAVFRQVPYQPYVRIALWTAFLGSAFLDLPAQLLRAQGRAGWFVALNVAVMVVTTVGAIVMVAYLGLGARGALLANLAGVLIVAIPCSFFLLHIVRFRLEPRLLLRCLAFSIPMIPHFLAQWVMGFSDRVVLERYTTLGDVGVYTAGYTVGWSLSLVRLGLAQAMIPVYGDLAVEEDGQRMAVARLVTHYVWALAIVATLLGTIGSDLAAFILPGTYADARVIIRIVVIGALFFGLYNPGVQVLNITLGRTAMVGVITLAGAALNLGLNVWLIPQYGIYAAATTTALTYLCVSVAVLLLAARAASIPYELGRLGGIILVAVSAILLVEGLPAGGPWVTAGEGVFACLVASWLWLKMGVISANEREALLSAWRGARRRTRSGD